MKHPYQIIICGESLFLLAIAARLSAHPNFEVEQVARNLPGLSQWVLARRPDFVIVEGTNPPENFSRVLLHHGLNIAELEPNLDQIIFYTGHQHPISDPDDLFLLFERIHNYQQFIQTQIEPHQSR